MTGFVPLRVAAVDADTRETVVVTFDVPPEQRARFAFDCGQHLTLRADVDGADLRRSYSICSPAPDGALRVAIKRTPGGAFSNWAHAALQPGAVLDVMPPLGHFHWPPAPGEDRRYLAFAAGSGITPLLSIVATTLAHEPGSHFTLVYGNRSTSSVIFRDALAELKDVYRERLAIVWIMSRETQDIELFNGRITRAKCDALFARWITVADHDRAYVCGPDGMMQDVVDALVAHGMAREHVKVERYASSIPKKPLEHAPRPVVGAGEAEITLLIDGAERRYTMAKDTASVLDAGLAHGIDIRYSCKGGVCSTCRCKVVEGRVEMDANYALEDYEVARGFVLACQSFPVTDRVVLDFDQDT